MIEAIIKCIIFTPVAYLIRFACIILTPLAVLFIDENGRLPRIFHWMETHDDLGWSGPLSVDATRRKTEKYGRKIGMMFWLWRNQAYSAQYKLFSIPYLTRKLETRPIFESGTIEIPKYGPSYSFTIVEVERKKYFELQPRLSLGKLLIYFRIGWKVQGLPAIIKNGGYPVGSQGMFTGFTPRTDVIK